MTIKYLPRIANCGEIYFIIPFQQNGYILLNLLYLLKSSGNLEFAKCGQDGFVGQGTGEWC
jgi:hypothetical protein